MRQIRLEELEPINYTIMAEGTLLSKTALFL